MNLTRLPSTSFHPWGAVLAIALAAGHTPAVAQQDYPARPVSIVVPFAAGGAVDTAARLVAQQLTTTMGQSFVVENKPGASGTIGMAYVAKAPADGYTLAWGSSSSLASSPYLYKSPGYDPLKSFQPISMATSSAWVLLVPGNSPASSVAGLVALAKSKPAKLSYASSGVNGNLHLIAALFANAAGFDAVHIPYKGGIEASTAVMTGQVDFTFDAIAAHGGSIKDGKLRALAVTSQARDKALPEVPTLAESGLPKLTMVTFNGLLAPAGTPPAVVARLTAAMKQVMADAAFRERMKRSGNDPLGSTPEEFRAMIEKQSSLWLTAIKLNGIVPE